MIICGSFTDDFLRYPPTLVVEILAESTRMKDRNDKFNLYESAGVQFYLLVDSLKDTIEVFELINNRFASKKDNFNFQLDKNCLVNLNTVAVCS